MGGGQIGQILGPFMITHGLSCDRVGFGHFGGGHMTPPDPPWLRACDSDSDSSVGLYSVTVPHKSTDAMYVQLQVEGIDLTMELDTGASVSVIGVQQYKELYPHVPLRKTQLRLQMYNKSVSRPKGVIQVEVWYRDKVHSLLLYVIDKGDQPLLGRNWLREIKLDWPK